MHNLHEGRADLGLHSASKLRLTGNAETYKYQVFGVWSLRVVDAVLYVNFSHFAAFSAISAKLLPHRMTGTVDKLT